MVRGRRVASPFRSQEPPPPPQTPSLSASHLQQRGPPTKPRAGRAAFHPTACGRGTGNTNPPIVPYHALSAPNGDAWGGPQPANRNCPGAVPDARSVAPCDWAGPAVFLQSDASAGPHTLGHPLAWEALVPEENRPMNVGAEHVCPFLEVPGNHFRLVANV